MQMNKQSLFLKKTVLGLSVSLALMFSGVANSAGMNEVLNEQFGMMSNVTQPGVFESQRRGVIAGGSMVLRNPTVNTQLVSFVPPSWKGSCGGIDLFAGSFSFINGEQFVQLLRAIAANAAGYAFQLALSNVCEQCMTHIASLQKGMQALNEHTANSCQIAQGIVNTATDGLDLKHKTNVRLETAMGGIFPDFTAGITQTGGKDAEQELKDKDKQKYEEIVTGNVVWREIKRNEISRWYTSIGGIDNDFLEEVMSFTGTVIFDDIEGKEGEKSTPKTIVEPTIRLADLVDGNPNASIFRCSDSQDQNKCLKVTRQNRAIRGIRDRIEEVLIGADGAGGAVAKFAMAQDGSTLTQIERNVWAALPQSVGSKLALLVRQSQTAAVQAVRDVSGVVATEMAYNASKEILRSVEVSLSSGKVERADEARKVLDKTAFNMRQDHQLLINRYGSVSDSLEKLQRLVKAVHVTEVYVNENKPGTNTNAPLR